MRSIKAGFLLLDEVNQGSSVCIIGSEVVKDIFKNKEDPFGQVISIGPGKYRVVGVLKEKGSSMGFSGDRSCYIPLTNVRATVFHGRICRFPSM